MDDDQEKCMKLAEPLLRDMHEIWHHAFGEYQRYPADLKAEHDETTAANCIRAHAWTEVKRRFENRKGFNLIRLRRLNLLLHGSDTVWRFKRVDGAGKHQNYQTEQQQDFDDQLELPGIPPAAIRLTSGYQPDIAAIAIERIIVARPMGRDILWAAQVNLVDAKPAWEDITPERLPGTERVQFRPRRRNRE